jgi:hypothetical protein
MVRVEGLEPSCLATADFKSAMYTIPPHSHMVLAVGIEPTSTALQTAAMTTSAKPAYCLGCLTSIDLVLPVSQTSVQATTLKTP